MVNVYYQVEFLFDTNLNKTNGIKCAEVMSHVNLLYTTNSVKRLRVCLMLPIMINCVLLA